MASTNLQSFGIDHKKNLWRQEERDKKEMESGSESSSGSESGEEKWALGPKNKNLVARLMENVVPESMGDNLFHRLVVRGLKGDDFPRDLAWQHEEESLEEMKRAPLRKGYHFFEKLSGFKQGGSKSAAKRSSKGYLVEKFKVPKEQAPEGEKLQYHIYKLRKVPKHEESRWKRLSQRRLIYVSENSRKFNSEHRQKAGVKLTKDETKRMSIDEDLLNTPQSSP